MTILEPVFGLDPGIADLVNWLRRMGFQTCDSGDGDKVGMECSLSYPHVFIQTEGDRLVEESHRLRACIENAGVRIHSPSDHLPYIQATYSPCDGVGLIELAHVRSVDVVRCVRNN